MNRQTLCIAGCAALVFASGFASAQQGPQRGDRGDRGGYDRSRGDAGQHRSNSGRESFRNHDRTPRVDGRQGFRDRDGSPRIGDGRPGFRHEVPRGRGGHDGWGRPSGPPHGYRPAPPRNRYYGERYFAPPVARHYAPYAAIPYYSYEVYEPPVYITQEYVVSPPPPVMIPPPPPPPPQEVYVPQPLAQAVPPPQPLPAPVPVPQPAPAPRLERYTLSASELFEFDRDELRSVQPKLDEIAAALNANPQISNVNITGFTDRLGTDSYNLALSQRRADAVKNYLVGKGVAENRLNAIGRGEANPVVKCNDTNRAALIKCLEPNRRVIVEQILVVRKG